jgi:hypothetical protein
MILIRSCPVCVLGWKTNWLGTLIRCRCHQHPSRFSRIKSRILAIAKGYQNA